jgi:hypothetical protein
MSYSQPLQGPHESNSPWRQMQYITPKHNKYNTGCKTLKPPSESLTDGHSATRGVLPPLGNTKASFPAKWKPRFLATDVIQIHFLTALTRSSIPYETGTTKCDEFPSWYTVGLTVCCTPETGQLMCPAQYNVAACSGLFDCGQQCCLYSSWCIW